MYRLLIVDDEEIIANGLYEIFCGLDKYELDVYKAYSGEEAIRWLDRTRIDIVISDIYMPEMDGLRLADEIYRRWPQCKVIFLTGHGEFESVYRAIQRPGVSYLLKTEDMENVINKVGEAVSALEAEARTGDLIHQANEQTRMAINLFQNDFFTRVMYGGGPAEVTSRLFTELSIPLNAEYPVIMALGQADDLPESDNYTAKIQILYSVRQIIIRRLSTHVNIAAALDFSDRLVVFIQPKELPPVVAGEAGLYKQTLLFLKGILEIIQSSCSSSLGVTISFSVGSAPCEWREVSKKYTLLSQLLNYRIGSGGELLLEEHEIGNSIRGGGIPSDLYGDTADSAVTEALSDLLRQKKPFLLEQYLETGQKEKYANHLSALLSPLRGVRSRNNAVALEAYHAISISLLAFINKWKLYEKVAFCIGLNRLCRADLFDSWGDAAEYLGKLSETLFDIQDNEQTKRAGNTIAFLQNFISGHLNEDLSLVRLAEQVFLNPSYLSRIYKQETGTKLSDFIEAARLNKAKELLSDEQLKIGEIAAMVGYETNASFARFFRKAAGCSPNEYRVSLFRLRK